MGDGPAIERLAELSEQTGQSLGYGTVDQVVAEIRKALAAAPTERKPLSLTRER